MDCGIVRALFKKRPSQVQTHVNKDEQTEEAKQQQTTVSTEIVSGNTDQSVDRYENGRRYNNRTDVAYVLPNDEKENDRVHQQHWLFKLAFDGNFSAPVADDLDKGIVVQDAGCGPGTWTLEMANDFPRSTFYGTDVSTVFPQSIKPNNCHFQVHNLLDEAGFPENHFNYIHQRMLILGILEKDWEKLIREHVRTLAPGGWLECMELPIYRAQNPGPNHAIVVNAWKTLCKAKGLYFDIPDNLERIFKSAGLINIELKEVGLPMNQDTQIGRLMWEDFREVFFALKPIIVIANPELAGEERYLEFLNDCLREGTELGSSQSFYRVWGQKPLQAEDDHTN